MLPIAAVLGEFHSCLLVSRFSEETNTAISVLNKKKKVTQNEFKKYAKCFHSKLSLRIIYLTNSSFFLRRQCGHFD